MGHLASSRCGALAIHRGGKMRLGLMAGVFDMHVMRMGCAVGFVRGRF